MTEMQVLEIIPTTRARGSTKTIVVGIEVEEANVLSVEEEFTTTNRVVEVLTAILYYQN